MQTESFEWPHGRHSKERRYAKDGKTVLVSPVDPDCPTCMEALRSKMLEVKPLIRDVALAMSRERRKFLSFAEVRRTLAWLTQSFPWSLTFVAEGRTRHYTMDRHAYSRLLKTLLLEFEDAASLRAGTTSR